MGYVCRDEPAEQKGSWCMNWSDLLITNGFKKKPSSERGAEKGKESET